MNHIVTGWRKMTSSVDKVLIALTDASLLGVLYNDLKRKTQLMPDHLDVVLRNLARHNKVKKVTGRWYLYEHGKSKTRKVKFQTSRLSESEWFEIFSSLQESGDTKRSPACASLLRRLDQRFDFSAKITPSFL